MKNKFISRILLSILIISPTLQAYVGALEQGNKQVTIGNKVKTALKTTGSTIVPVAKGAGTVAKFIFNNSDKLVSKKTLATALIFGGPYFHFNPNAATLVGTYLGEIIVKLNAKIAEGLIKGAINNPAALAKLAAILTAERTGRELIAAAGKALAGATVVKAGALITTAGTLIQGLF